MTNTLTLLQPDAGCEGGCQPDQDPWEPNGFKNVRIINDSGSTQEIWGISNDCLIKRGNGKPKKSVKLKQGKSWLGKAGRHGVNGEYRYNDGCPDEVNLGVRAGQIDPS